MNETCNTCVSKISQRVRIEEDNTKHNNYRYINHVLAILTNNSFLLLNIADTASILNKALYIKLLDITFVIFKAHKRFPFYLSVLHVVAPIYIIC